MVNILKEQKKIVVLFALLITNKKDLSCKEAQTLVELQEATIQART